MNVVAVLVVMNSVIRDNVTSRTGRRWRRPRAQDSMIELPRAECAFPGPLRDQLVAAILDGVRTSTTGLLLDRELRGIPLPRPGDRSVLVDSDERGCAILETTGIRVLPLAEVDLAHAVDEGHRTVAQWRAAHESLWYSAPTRAGLGRPACTVDDATLVVAERFRLVQRIWRPDELNAAFATEAGALADAMRAVTAPGWRRPTRCPPWTVKELLAHTVTAVERTLDMLDAGEVTDMPAGDLVPADRYYVPDQRFDPDVDRARIVDAQRRATVPATELVAEFDRVWQAVAERVAGEPADRRVVTRHGDPMRLTDFQVTRVVEAATHGLDLADALGVPPWLTGSAADVVEGLVFGATAGRIRQEYGWDRPRLLRKVTGRTPLGDDERTALAGRNARWPFLG